MVKTLSTSITIHMLCVYFPDRVIRCPSNESIK